MKNLLKLVIVSLALSSTFAIAAPSAIECKVTDKITSPEGQLISVVGFLTGALEPVSGTILLAVASYRNTDCPKVRYVTKDEYDELKRQVEELKSLK